MLVSSTSRIIIGRALGLRSSSSSYRRQQHQRTDRSSRWRNRSSAKRFRKSDFMCDIGEEDVALVHGEILYGFHPVSMALSAGRRDFHAIYYNAEGKDKVLRLAEEAKAKGMPKLVKRPLVRLWHAIFVAIYSKESASAPPTPAAWRASRRGATGIAASTRACART